MRAQHDRFRPFALLALSTAFVASSACVASSETEAVPQDDIATEELAYDSFTRPTLHGELQLGEDSSAVITDDERYHAFEFSLTERSDVRLYTLPALYGNDAVDTVAYLYKQGSRGFGSNIASSDNARNTMWSEIKRKLEPGQYRLVVKGKSGHVRGAFRVGFDCPQCLGTSRCVLGKTFGLVRRSLTVKVERERLVNDVVQLSADERLQLVDALHASSHTDVTTPEEALRRVDGNEVNVLHLWDATNARALVAFEYGAGDNSYGRIYPPASTSAVATIHDGDVVGCTLRPGKGGRDCRADAECGAGFTCGGISPVSRLGTCSTTTLSTAGVGMSCTAEDAGTCSAGLVCGGLSHGPSGLCQPRWLQGSFSEWYGATIPDGNTAGVSRVLDVHGLGSVDVDVEIDLYVRHLATGQLRVTLTNPAGNELTVFEGTTNGKDLHVQAPVAGLSGDESVNGSWTLRVVDDKRGTIGTLERWGLRITSRWD
jgi:hypothetical protein